MAMSVDLPAPFSPNRTCTSPDRRSKSTLVQRPDAGKLPGDPGEIEKRRVPLRKGPASRTPSFAPDRQQSPAPLQFTVKVGLKPSGASDEPRSKVSMFFESIT